MIYKNTNYPSCIVLFTLIIVSGIALAYSTDLAYAADDHAYSSMTIGGDGYGDGDTKKHTSSPFAQYRDGVFINAITCTNPNELYIRDNSFPVCVRESTYERLLMRGLDLVPYNESPLANEIRTITIHSLSPLTGGAFSYGQDISAGSEAAVSDFNLFLEERGEPWRLALQTYDTMTDNSVLFDQIVALNDQGVRIVAGPSIDLYDHRLIKYATENNMLLFSCCSSVVSYATSDDALFRMLPNLSNHGHKVAEVINDAGIKALITVGRDAPWITDILDSATTKFIELGGESTGSSILYNILGEFDSTHTQTLADRLSANMELYDAQDIGILFVGFEETFDFLELASSHDVLHDVRWFGADANTIQHDNQNALVFAEQVDFTSIQPTAPESDLKTRLIIQISEKLERTPSGYTIIAYDLIYILGNAILETQSTSSAHIIKALPTVAQEYAGVSGPIAFDDAGDRSSMEYATWNLRNGMWVDDSSPYTPLNAQERAWLESNPEIRVAYAPDWAPFEYVTEDGTVNGLTPQLLSAFEDITGADFVLVPDITSWSDALDRLESRTADVEFLIVDTAERREYLGFTTPYLTITTDIVTLGNEPITPEQLASLRVATIQEAAIETWLDENYPDVDYISVPHLQAAVEMLSEGEIDAFLESWEAVHYAAEQLGITGVYNAGPTGHGYDLSIGYRGDQPILGSILQKALDAVPDTTFVLSRSLD